MKLCLKVIIIILPVFFYLSVVGQQTDSIVTGSVSGSVKDTSLNYFLQSATVSVYRAKDVKLIAYSLTNNLGEYHIKGLPLNFLLDLKISFVGYQTYSRRFVITVSNNVFNAGEVSMTAGSSGLLDNIILAPPPVGMHGDTLEFNTSAFELDKNAVAEDLLKKLPGIIVWGDGTITANGRQINKLLVNGKPFFNGDYKVAIQNIPKDAIDKVQVYREFIDPNNPLDSITSINFKLGKNKQTGYFGSISTGIGTNEKYEGEINGNFFTPASQFAIIGQSNNINKLGNDINTLLRNNAYKGKGAKVEYQPNFNIQGLNKQNSGGMLFTHDFLPNFNQYERNRISVNSFLNQISNKTEKQTATLHFFADGSTLEQNSNNDLESNTSEFNLSTRYNKSKDNDSLFVEGKYNLTRENKIELFNNKIFGSNIGFLSNGNQYDSSGRDSHQLSFRAGYDHQGYFNNNAPKLTKWNISYALISETENLNRTLKSSLADSTNPLLNQFYNRKYNNKQTTVRQDISMKLGDFSKWLFINNRTLSGFSIQFENDMRLTVEKRGNKIADNDTSMHKYIKNNYLSSVSTYQNLNGTTGFRIGKIRSNILANRYHKELSFDLSAKIQFIEENNTSTHAFQYLNKSYRSFIPTVNISYSNFQYGEFVDRYTLNFNTSLKAPSLDQRFPLIDSSDIYFIRAGNPKLTESKNNEVSFQFRHNSTSRKNTFNYGASISVGITDNYFADSIVVEKTGRSTYYSTNLDGYKYLNAHAFLNKAFIIGNSQFQLNLLATAVKSRNPGYFRYFNSGNTSKRFSNIFIQTDSVSINYTYKDIFALNFLQYLSFFNSQQSGFSNTKFNSVHRVSRIGISVNPINKLSLASNISFTQDKFSNFSANRSTILNAFLSYRFLESDNLELKLSGLDLLNQNKGIINFGNNYSYTHGTVNLLHQYFMATITYFPRKFGKKSK